MSSSIPPVPRHSPFRSDVCKGTVALITGGGSGIGFEIAKQIGKHGGQVMIMGRRAPVLQSAVSSLRSEGVTADFVCGDVRRIEDARSAVDKCVATFGGVTCVVNCAAGNFLVTADGLSSNALSTVIGIDTIGTFHMCSAAFPQLKKSSISGGNASIINISATLHRPATHYQLHASAAKAAVDSITRSLALEWGEYGIRVNGVAPGPIQDTVGMDKLSAGAAKAEYEKGLPLKRMGSKFEIALMCVYLISDAANYISGDTITVDGAACLWRPPITSADKIRAFSTAMEKKQKVQPTAVATASSSANKQQTQIPSKL